MYIYIYVCSPAPPHDLPSVGLGVEWGAHVALKLLQAGSLPLRRCTVRYVRPCLLLCLYVY